MTLQDHNLWHEDRTAAGQGIESRIPFLDHLVLELAASIPRTQHEELFRDKRIVRDLARGVLPHELTRRPKVGFYRVHDVSSIHAILGGTVERVFPSFDEAYLAPPDALLSRERMTELRARVDLGGLAGSGAAALLLSAMALAVFHALCNKLPRGWMPHGLDPPSPFETGHAPATWGAAEDPPAPNWAPSSRVALEPEVEIVRPLADGGTSTVMVLRRDMREEEIEVERDVVWLMMLLERLSTRVEPMPLGELSVELNVPMDELVDAVEFLWSRGWVRVL